MQQPGQNQSTKRDLCGAVGSVVAFAFEITSSIPTEVGSFFRMKEKPKTSEGT